MSLYRLKNPTVQAFKYMDEVFKDLPDWIKNFKSFSPINGETPVWKSTTQILNVPKPSGDGYIRCNRGDWIVMQDGKLYVFNPAKFADLYEEEVAPTPQIANTGQASEEQA